MKNLAPHFDIKMDQTPIANLLHAVLPGDRAGGLLRRNSLVDWWQAHAPSLPSVNEEGERHRARRTRWRNLINNVGLAGGGGAGHDPNARPRRMLRTGSLPLPLGKRRRSREAHGLGTGPRGPPGAAAPLPRSSSLPQSDSWEPGPPGAKGGSGPSRGGSGGGTKASPVGELRGNNAVTPAPGSVHGLARISMAAPLASRADSEGRTASASRGQPRMRDYVGPRDIARKTHHSKYQVRRPVCSHRLLLFDAGLRQGPVDAYSHDMFSG